MAGFEEKEEKSALELCLFALDHDGCLDKAQDEAVADFINSIIKDKNRENLTVVIASGSSRQSPDLDEANQTINQNGFRHDRLVRLAQYLKANNLKDIKLVYDPLTLFEIDCDRTTMRCFRGDELSRAYMVKLFGRYQTVGQCKSDKFLIMMQFTLKYVALYPHHKLYFYLIDDWQTILVNTRIAFDEIASTIPNRMEFRPYLKVRGEDFCVKPYGLVANGKCVNDNELIPHPLNDLADLAKRLDEVCLEHTREGSCCLFWSTNLYKQAFLKKPLVACEEFTLDKASHHQINASTPLLKNGEEPHSVVGGSNSLN